MSDVLEAISQFDKGTVALIAVAAIYIAKASLAVIGRHLNTDRISQHNAIADISNKLGKLEREQEREASRIESKLDQHIAECNIRYELQRK